MIYKHGTFEHDVHFATEEIVPEYNSLGQIIRTNYRFAIEGKVEGSTQAAIKTAGEALEAAYLGAQVTTSGLLHSDETTPSLHYLDIGSLSTEKGIVPRLRWIDSGSEYVYKREFQIVIECSILGAGGIEYEYSNRLIRIGDGGPPEVGRNTFSGPIIQQTYPASPYRGVETGRKSSRIAAVLPISPSYPSITQHDNRVRDSGYSRGADGITHYFANWTYQLLSTTSF